MKRALQTLLISLLTLFVACDPGISIHQIETGNAPANQSGPSGQMVAVRVATTRSLIGEATYTPKVTVTNTAETPITISRIELSTRFGTLENKIRTAETSPIVVPSKGTADVEVWFDLGHSMDYTFEEAAELRVHYTSGKQELVTHVTVQGGFDRGN
ncbi:MAG: hypothetical protein QOJ64_3487 [Acidobacteriota bacterium]|nr:hypothetical protein [Acidobacteriota bacterium]